MKLLEYMCVHNVPSSVKTPFFQVHNLKYIKNLTWWNNSDLGLSRKLLEKWHSAAQPYKPVLWDKFEETRTWKHNLSKFAKHINENKIANTYKIPIAASWGISKTISSRPNVSLSRLKNRRCYTRN